MNLLAQKPYTKKRDSVIPAPLMLLSKRFGLFRKFLDNCPADIFLFQEVDEHWKEWLEVCLKEKEFSLMIGRCRSLGMAVGFKSSRFKLLGDVQIWPEAGIMALNLFDLNEEMAFVLVNVHADWGRAGFYRNDFESAFKPVGPLVIGGDFNLDDFRKPGENQNKDIFDCLIETCQLIEFSSGLDFTAKSVYDASFPVKLDMVMGRRFIPLETYRIPSRFVHLVPHTRDEQFRMDDENNHFSDHAALVVALEYES